jgi:hypothetical protein
MTMSVLNLHAETLSRSVPQGVNAWRAMKNVPAEEMQLDGGRRYRRAVWCAKVLQMSAVISTQRITPETMVAESLNELQKLMDRKKDRAESKQMHNDNTQARIARHKENHKKGIKITKVQKKMRNQHLWSVDIGTAMTGVVSEDTFMETINWKSRNAFLTRKTWCVRWHPRYPTNMSALPTVLKYCFVAMYERLNWEH